MDFTKAEIINLILGFKITPCGYWIDIDYKLPELIRFQEEGYTRIDENDNRKIVLNEKGKDFLHPYIIQGVKDFILLIQRHGTKCLSDEVIDWFLTTYSLNDKKLAEDFCDYLCSIPNDFGCIIYKPSPERNQNYYQIRQL